MVGTESRETIAGINFHAGVQTKVCNARPSVIQSPIPLILRG